jgi:hypothetical protein
MVGGMRRLPKTYVRREAHFKGEESSPASEASLKYKPLYIDD